MFHHCGSILQQLKPGTAVFAGMFTLPVFLDNSVYSSQEGVADRCLRYGCVVIIKYKYIGLLTQRAVEDVLLRTARQI